MNPNKNHSSIVDVSKRTAALAAGFGLLLMTAAVLFADGYAHQGLIEQGDASRTVHNIQAQEGLFRIGIYSYLVVIICDVVVAWALYIFFLSVNNSLSLIAAWLRLVYSVIFVIAVLNFLSVLQLISAEEYLTAYNPNQLHVQVMLSLQTFTEEWDLGFVFFGLHLLLLGYLILKSSDVPTIFGVIIVLAGLGYLIKNIGEFLFPSYDLTGVTFFGWGELLFGLWLLWKGGKSPKTEF